MRLSVTAATVVFLLAGCTSPEWHELDCMELQGAEEGSWVATTQEELEAHWTASCGDQPVPDVDLGTQQVVAYLWGERPTGGYVLSVKEVVAGSPNQVVIDRSSPGPSCGTSQALTYPTLVVAVQLEGPTEVVTEDSVRDCLDE